MSVSARSALVFGASAALGRALCAALSDWTLTAVSRYAQPARPGLQWRQSSLEGFSATTRFDAVFSCGPLDAFADWYARNPSVSPRLIAFSSTSIEVKHHSTDPQERALAERLTQAEQRLRALTGEHAAALTVLRPTLIYGRGQAAGLAQIAALAQGYGLVALPWRAHGLRQPVHVDDLAAAARAAADWSGPGQRCFNLPGGETLGYAEMVRRVLAVSAPRARQCVLPMTIFQSALRLAHARGHFQDLRPAILQRMRADLVFDAAPAAAALGYRPRPFRPQAGDLLCIGRATLTSPDTAMPPD